MFVSLFQTFHGVLYKFQFRDLLFVLQILWLSDLPFPNNGGYGIQHVFVLLDDVSIRLGIVYKLF